MLVAVVVVTDAVAVWTVIVAWSLTLLAAVELAVLVDVECDAIDDDAMLVVLLLSSSESECECISRLMLKLIFSVKTIIVNITHANIHMIESRLQMQTGTDSLNRCAGLRVW